MKVEDIKKELDKYEIPYKANDDKPTLQALLDSELAKRASGNDTGTDPDVEALLDTDEPVVEAEPELTAEERDAIVADAQAELAAAEETIRAAQEVVTISQKAIAENLPSTRQATLADCNKNFHNAVRKDAALKVEMETITQRFKEEAEQILDTEE